MRRPEGRSLEWGEDGTWCVRVGGRGAVIWSGTLKPVDPSVGEWEVVYSDRWMYKTETRHVRLQTGPTLAEALQSFREWAEDADAKAVDKAKRYDRWRRW